MSEKMSMLAQGFVDVDNEVISLERLRNNIRRILHQGLPELFPYGNAGASVLELTEKMLHNDHSNASTQLQCTNCDFVDNAINDRLTSVIHGIPHISTTTRDQLQTTLVSNSRVVCPECISPLKNVLTFLYFPKLLFFSIGGNHEISISKTINVRTGTGLKKSNLRGIVYHGGFHFTSRIIKDDGNVWFHGQLGRDGIMEKHVQDFNEMELRNCNERVACLVLYTQK